MIEVIGDEVRLRPVRSVAGALSGYGGKKSTLKEIRENVWKKRTIRKGCKGGESPWQLSMIK